MSSRGFSLIEMLFAIAICSILLAIAILNFRDYMRRSRIESQTRLIHGELQNARLAALTQKREVEVRFYPDRFAIYSSSSGPAVAPKSVRYLEYPLTYGKSGFSEPYEPVRFDSRGTTSDYKSFCVDTTKPTGTLDSVTIHYVRIALGSRVDVTKGCSSDSSENNIDFR